jgi:[ribosomal protein S5]-alanine N-acetyltransferase
MRIETGRLIIKSFQESDAFGLLDYLSHPRVNCFIDEKLNTLEEAIADVKRRDKDELQFAVCLKENDSTEHQNMRIRFNMLF